MSIEPIISLTDDEKISLVDNVLIAKDGLASLSDKNAKLVMIAIKNSKKEMKWINQ